MQDLIEPVPSEVMAALRDVGSRQTLTPGQRLFEQGAPPSRAYLIDSGVVKLSSVSRHGGQSLVALRGAGDIIGQRGVLDGRVRGTDAHALVRTELLWLPRDQFLELLARLPEFSLAMLADLSLQLRAATSYIADLTAERVPVLVARRIVQLAVDPRLAPLRISKGEHIVVESALSQSDLAAWAGVSDRSFGVALHQFRDDALIETGRMRIVVLDVDRLRDRGELPRPTHTPT